MIIILRFLRLKSLGLALFTDLTFKIRSVKLSYWENSVAIWFSDKIPKREVEKCKKMK